MLGLLAASVFAVAPGGQAGPSLVPGKFWQQNLLSRGRAG